MERGEKAIAECTYHYNSLDTGPSSTPVRTGNSQFPEAGSNPVGPAKIKFKKPVDMLRMICYKFIIETAIIAL